MSTPPRAQIPQDRTTPALALHLTDRPDPRIPPITLPKGKLTLLEIQHGTPPGPSRGPMPRPRAHGFQAIRHRLVLDCAENGRSVFHLLGGNRLDSMGLARKAQARGLDPGYALRASHIARAFTAYQLSALLQDTLPGHLQDHQDIALVILSDPLALYTEEDVPRHEGLTLTRQAIQDLATAAHAHQVPALLVQPPRTGRAFMDALHQHAHEHVRVIDRPDGDGRIIHRLGKGDPVFIADPGRSQATLEAFGLDDPATLTDHAIPEVDPAPAPTRAYDASWRPRRPAPLEGISDG